MALRKPTSASGHRFLVVATDLVCVSVSWGGLGGILVTAGQRGWDPMAGTGMARQYEWRAVGRQLWDYAAKHAAWHPRGTQEADAAVAVRSRARCNCARQSTAGAGRGLPRRMRTRKSFLRRSSMSAW